MAGKRRQAQVAFFEIRDASGEPLEEPIDWQEALSYIARQGIDDRKHPMNGALHWGQVYPYEGNDEFILARKREEVSALNTSTGEIVDTESDASSPWVELSFVHFLPKTNRLAMVLGSNASPRISSVVTWINLHQILDDEISVAPVIDRRVLEKIEGAAAARLLRVTFEADRLGEIRNAGALAEAAQKLNQSFGNVEVSLELRIGPAAVQEPEGLSILKAVRDVAATTDFKKAFASLVRFDASGKKHKDDVNFVNHRLAQTVRIEMTNREGQSVRVRSVFDAIYRAVDRHRRDLFG